MDKKRLQQRSIETSETILTAMKKMDAVRSKLLFVMNHGKFSGLLTVGDLQRAIIAGNTTSTLIDEILVSSKKYAHASDLFSDIKQKMLQIRAECMPVLNDEGELVEVYFWEDLFQNEKMDNRPLIDLPVVIMAGGLGTRLRPLTNVIPKPLIPIGEKTILETIFDQFEEIGCHKFFLSVNYKAAMIQYYLNNLDRRYDVEYFKEESPMGTIGSVSLLRDKIHSSFFVSNCDILINQDYRDVYEYHNKNKNDITLIASIKDYQIPYGVVETGADGIITALSEKPQNTFMVNTGVYLLEQHVIDLIPNNRFFHITTLIETIRDQGGRVGCFPVSEKAWTDIGDWNEYNKIIQ